jgi:uncharacterized iron-regulated membrane protein
MALKLAAARRLWLLLHRYLALVLGLTGSLAIYGEGLDRLLNPRLAIGAFSGQPLSLDALLAEVRQAHPDLHGSWTLELPRSTEEPLTAVFEKPPKCEFRSHSATDSMSIRPPVPRASGH